MIHPPVMRRCRDCKQRMPRDAFHYAPGKKRKTDGRIPYRKDCRRCQSKAACRRDHELRTNPEAAEAYRRRRSEAFARYSKANPDLRREWQRRFEEKQREDAERHARRLEMNRAAYRRRMRRKQFGRGWWDEPDYKEPRASKAMAMVPVGPLLEFMRKAFPGATHTELAQLLKLDSSNARRIFDGTHQRVSVVIIDRALTSGLGRPDLLDVLYPMEET